MNGLFNSSSITTIHPVSVKGLPLPVIELRLKIEQKRRLADKIDPSGELMKKIRILYYQTDTLVAFWIEKRNFEQMVNVLNEASRARRDVYSLLESCRRKRWY